MPISSTFSANLKVTYFSYFCGQKAGTDLKRIYIGSIIQICSSNDSYRKKHKLTPIFFFQRYASMFASSMAMPSSAPGASKGPTLTLAEDDVE